MKVVKIKDNYYGVIEDNDDLTALQAYVVDIYAMDDEQYDGPNEVIRCIDDMNRIVCKNGAVLLPEIDSFAVLFGICPSVISEARFRFLCDKANINYKSLAGVTMNIHRALNNNNFDIIKEEVADAIKKAVTIDVK